MKKTTRETGHLFFPLSRRAPLSNMQRSLPDPHSNAYRRRAPRYCTVYSLSSAALGTRSNLPFFIRAEQHGGRPSFRRYGANHTLFSIDMNSWILSKTCKHLLRQSYNLLQCSGDPRCVPYCFPLLLSFSRKTACFLFQAVQQIFLRTYHVTAF